MFSSILELALLQLKGTEARNDHQNHYLLQGVTAGSMRRLAVEPKIDGVLVDQRFIDKVSTLTPRSCHQPRAWAI